MGEGATSLPDGAADLGRSLSQPVASTSAVSKSQLRYFRRVKEKVAKQLINMMNMHNVKGYSKEVHNVMNMASVVGMTWGGDDNKLLDLLSAREWKAQRMREFKNLDCSISPVKC
jgi:peptidase E